MKKTLAKTLALCLCLVMLLSMAACGGTPQETTPSTESSLSNETTPNSEPINNDDDNSSTEKVQITYAFWGNETEAAATQAVLDEFNAQNDHIEVIAEVIPWESYMETLNTRAMGGTLPDCGLMSEAGALQWASQGMLADVSSMYDGQDAKPLRSATFTYQGNDIAYAVANNSLLLFYNKAMFDAAGVDYPPVNAADAWTWDEFVQTAKLLTLDANGNNATSPDFDSNNIVQYGCMVENLTWQLEVWCRSNGSGFYNEDGTTVTINEQAATDAIQAIADLYLVDHVAPLSTGLTDDGVSRSLVAGTVAMTTNGAWNIGTSLASWKAEGNEYGIGVLPYMQEKVTIATGGPNVVFNQGEHQAEAMEFLKWYSREENNWELISNGTWAPVLSSYYEDEEMTHKWLDNPNFPDYEMSKAVLVDYVNECAVPTAWYFTNNTTDFNELLGSVLGAVWTGEKTAAEAINENIDALIAAHDGN